MTFHGNRPKSDPTGHPRQAVDKKRSSAGPIVTTAPPLPDTAPALDEKSSDLWDALWRLGVNVYGEAHVPVVSRYVEMQQRRRYLLACIDADGWTVTGSAGQPVLNPLARQLSDVETKLVGLEDRLGLSPEAGLRLGLATVEVKSKLDAFLEASGK
jgi:P27 family predicted phage terminase small subunit